MKIFILFALTSVSVCNDGSSGQRGSGSWSSSFQCDSEYKNDFANDARCLEHALQNVSGLGTFGLNINCRHRDNKVKKTEEYYKELKGQLEKFDGCSGCRVLAVQKTLGEAGSGLGDTAEELHEAIDNIKKSLGLDERVLNALCNLMNTFLASESAVKLNRQEEDLDGEPTTKILADTSRVPGDTMGTDDTMETRPIGRILQSVLCTVGDLLKNIVNGGIFDPDNVLGE